MVTCLSLNFVRNYQLDLSSVYITTLYIQFVYYVVNVTITVPAMRCTLVISKRYAMGYRFNVVDDLITTLPYLSAMYLQYVIKKISNS